MTITTQALGIFQADIILRTAIMAAIADLRARPYLLDYVFASLPADALTSTSYGQKEVDRAKEWFLKTNIPVVMVPRIDEAKIPCITIKLVSSAEAENEVTLGDIHYVTSELTDWSTPLTDKFTPSSYVASTGAMTIPSSVTLILAVGQVVVDAQGGEHPILNINDDGSVQIAPTRADFTGAYIKGAAPDTSVTLESAPYRESYQIGVHVAGEPVYLSWLHSIVTFCLLTYKQALLEARGFERSVFQSSDFDRNEISEGELVFSRYITISGYVRQYWPKDFEPLIYSVETVLQVIGGDHLPSDQNPANALWIGDLDTVP